MRQNLSAAACIVLCLPLLFAACSQPANSGTSTNDSTAATAKYGGYESPVKWGEHLVKIGGCNDCHTPKKMGPRGPEIDTTLMLSGHPAQMPAPDIDRKMVEAKGLGVTNTETAWVGPWGISFAANITPDSSGIGTWSEEQWMKCVKEGKYMGLDNTRPIMPPMPITSTSNMTDDELKAIFAYLKSIKPIHNVVPAYMPPVTAMKH